MSAVDKSFVAQCKTCKHYKALKAQVEHGQCRRYPPSVSDDGGEQHRPIVESINICGEYVPAMRSG